MRLCNQFPSKFTSTFETKMKNKSIRRPTQWISLIIKNIDVKETYEVSVVVIVY